MKEIRISALNDDEKRELENLRRGERAIEKRIAQHHSAQAAFWLLLKEKHNLQGGNHYVLRNVIYKQVV